MTSIELYKSFLLKLNKNDTNYNISVPKSQFVLIFNEQTIQWLDDKLKIKESSNYIEDLQILFEPYTRLEYSKSYSDRVDYILPADFFRRVSSYVIADKSKCKNRRLTNWLIKPKDLDLLLTNSNFNPSFDWEETISVLNDNKITIFFNDFKISDVYLSYYKKPIEIDIEGYIKIDGTQSINIDSNLDDYSLTEILNRTVTEVVTNYLSPEQMQVSLNREQRNEVVR